MINQPWQPVPEYLNLGYYLKSATSVEKGGTRSRHVPGMTQLHWPCLEDSTSVPADQYQKLLYTWQHTEDNNWEIPETWQDKWDVVTCDGRSQCILPIVFRITYPTDSKAGERPYHPPLIIFRITYRTKLKREKDRNTVSPSPNYASYHISHKK